MVYLLLSIASSVLLFAVFRLMSREGINNFQAVVINYWTAGFIGTALFYREAAEFVSEPDRLIAAGLLGCLFIGVFYLMIKTTQEYSISVGSVANKMSVVIPAAAAMILYNEPVTIHKTAGIVLAVAGLYLTNLKSGTRAEKILGLLPVTVFLGSGLIDTILNYAAFRLIEQFEGSFTSLIFLCAAVIGTVAVLIKNKAVSVRTLTAGVLLGAVNFATIYFVLKALNSNILDAGAFFPVNNVSIVLGSVLVSVLFFKERLSKLNIAGVICAAGAILILSFD